MTVTSGIDLPGLSLSVLPPDYLEMRILRNRLEQGFASQQEADEWMTSWSQLTAGQAQPSPSESPFVNPLIALMSPTPSATPGSGNSGRTSGRTTVARGGKRPATVKFNRI